MSEPEAGVEEREPDYRFTLANERTFLAWIRTALGLLAGGVAVDQLAASAANGSARIAVSLTCIGLSTALASGAYSRWRSIQRAMRRDESLPSFGLIRILAVGTIVIAVLAGSAIVFS
ncbi:YidH family protein [Rhodococcus sp. NPDC059234]|uniref:YidH family protein n=1 Tax=Rhodococcus sp. NPDC059234 TaxID=3346781 RepID=UPI003671638C